MVVQICVGSSCHLKGSEEIVRLFQQALEKYDLTGEVTLAGSFCIGECNRTGVTVQVDGEVCPVLTPESFPAFFEEKILSRTGGKRSGE